MKRKIILAITVVSMSVAAGFGTAASAISQCQTTFHQHCGFWGCLEEDQEVYRDYVGGGYNKFDAHATAGGRTDHSMTYC